MRLKESAVCIASLFALIMIPQTLWAQEPGAAVVADTDESRIADLIAASHILAARGIIDGRGHVSVRSARNPAHYFMARMMPPGEVRRSDIVELDADSKPVSGDAPNVHVVSERFIHGEIYRKRSDIQAVVHCHPVEVLPFTVTQAPFKAVIHTASFLGSEPAPVFDLRSVEGEDNRMLVTNKVSGAALATTLGARSVVLMRGHGMSVGAASVPDVVFRSIYTILNAEVETKALRLGTPVFLNKFESQTGQLVGPLWENWKKQVENGKGESQ